MDRRRDVFRILAWSLFAAACAWAVAYHVLVDILPYDDAYITYRYSERLASGQGLTYNAGERVFGSSTPLYALWLAFLKTIIPSVSLPVLSVRGNLIFFLLAAGGAVALVRALVPGSLLAPIAGAAFAANASLCAVSSGGMESFLFLALVLWGITSAAQGRFLAAAALAGLSVTARPEGLLVMAVVLAAWWLAGRPRPVAFTALLLAAGALWGLFATLYFGTPLPHSIRAKMAPLYPLPAGSAHAIMRQWFGRWAIPVGLSEPIVLRDMVAFHLSNLGALGLVVSRDVRKRGGAIVSTLLVVLFLFYSLSNPLFFDWYSVNLFPFWLVNLIVGLPALGIVIARGHLGILRPRLVLGALAAAIVAYGAVSPYVLGEETIFEVSRTRMRLRTLGYREAARWMNGWIPEESTVAVPETGAFGYYWHGRVLDTCGLVSPQAVRFHPIAPDERHDAHTGAVPEDLVQSTSPEYVATLWIFAYRSILQSDWFEENYRLVASVPLPARVWDSEAVLVYQRRDRGEIPPPPPGPLEP